VHYITNASGGRFQPANITFDLLPPLEAPAAAAPGQRKPRMDRQERHRRQCERALGEHSQWLDALQMPSVCSEFPS
jgi:methylenetetrahydrofolate--tRNA-(uracil-5-)-methyltransferase